MAVIEVSPDRDGLVQAVAEHIVQLAAEGVATNDRFSLALSGGSTPRPVYALLASRLYVHRIDWSRVHVFWGDERCVPPDDPQSNFRMVRETLLEAVPLPPDNIHRIRGEDDPKQAAATYEQLLRAFFRDGVAGSPAVMTFDLVLLGMGDNGHTASLFPGLPAVTEQTRWVLAQYVEVASMWRVTLTPAAINAARNVTFVVSGPEKASRLREVLEGSIQPEVLPAQVIQPRQGQLSWFVDEPAAAHLKPETICRDR